MQPGDKYYVLQRNGETDITVEENNRSTRITAVIERDGRLRYDRVRGVFRGEQFVSFSGSVYNVIETRVIQSYTLGNPQYYDGPPYKGTDLIYSKDVRWTEVVHILDGKAYMGDLMWDILEGFV